MSADPRLDAFPAGFFARADEGPDDRFYAPDRVKLKVAFGVSKNSKAALPEAAVLREPARAAAPALLVPEAPA